MRRSVPWILLLCFATPRATAQDGARPPAADAPDAKRSADRDAPAQAPEPPDFATLVERVHRAHWGDRTDVALDRFAATLRLKHVARDADSIEARILAKFIAPRLLRYEIEEPGATRERGQDADGAWARTASGVYRLEGREFASERDEVRQHVRLARQILRYLDPRTTLRGLDAVSRPEAKDFVLGRLRMPCWTVAGRVDDFPIHGGVELGDGERIELRIWIERTRDRLAAVEARRLDRDGRPAPDSELILLHEHVERGAVLLPTHVLVYRVANDRPEPYLDVQVSAIDLSPDLDERDVSRPR